MASGDPVVQVLSIMPPAANYATFDVRPSASTPAENFPVWDFDPTAIEYLDFLCILRGYDGGGLTFTLPWSASTAASGQTRWEMAIRAVPDDTEDIDAAHTYDFNGLSDTAASASGEPSYPTIAFTNGADMDSWADGQVAIVRVRRDPTHVDDNMAGDAELWTISGIES